jgi:hypothetical protein
MPRTSTALQRTAMAATVLLILATVAPARTWRVERDGSADYTVIQDAVDVAASGDTILIGPGRFNEQRWVTCPGWQDSVRVLVHQHELTLIGSGPTTIIGQTEPWEMEQGYHKGIVASDFWGNRVIRVEKIRFENMARGIYTSYESTGEDTILVRSCEFYANNRGLTLFGDGGVATVTDCSFDHMARDGIHVAARRQSHLLIEDCTLTLWDHHTWPQKHLSIGGQQSAHIRDCRFIDGAYGLTVNIGASGYLERCTFDGQSALSIGADSSTNLQVVDCVFINQNQVASLITIFSAMSFRHCSLMNISDVAFRISYVGSFSVNDCDLSGGSRGIVWCEDRLDCAEVQTLDMTGNYWGTTDPDSIAASIRDYNDSAEACFIIDYEPFESDSTPTESRSFSDLKSLFD